VARTNKIRRVRSLEQEMALAIGLPVAQLRRGFRVVEVSNRTDADQRHSIRSKQTRTLRKLTRTEKLLRVGVIDAEQAAACEWYAAAHALGYDTLGVTANYEGSIGGGDAGHTHLARNRAQQGAREDYAYARGGVNAMLLPLLDRVLLQGRPIGRLGSSFRTAVRQLTERARY
jgi:hypothetical protein